MDELETQAQGTPDAAAPQEEVPAEQAVTDAAAQAEPAEPEEAGDESAQADAAPAEETPQEAAQSESVPAEGASETAADETIQPEPTAEEAAPSEEEGQSEQDAPQTISIEEWMASSQQTVVEAPKTADLEDVQLIAVLEACVYVAEEPLMPVQIAAALKQEPDRIRTMMQQLIAEYDKPEHGVCIKEVAGGYKMATKAEHHEAVRAFVKSLKAPLKLSLPALETLAVVAYKQPVTGPEIMDIRGVQGGGVLKTLLDRKLITESGRKNVIGKPILYKTTKEFLITFGLKDISELPTLKEFEEIRRMALSEPEAPAETPADEPAAEAQESAAEAPAPEAEAAPAAVETPASEPAATQEAEPAPEASTEPEPEKPATTESQEQ